MAKGNYLKKDEVEYIRQNCLSKSDEQMAEHLKRDFRTIRACRKKLGIRKTSGGRISEMNAAGTSLSGPLVASQTLSEDQRKEFFKTQLTNTLYYDNLKEQFTKEEIDFYLEEWSSLCVQFEDIVATEKRQIDELIKAEIMGNRMLRNIKITETEIECMTKEVEALRLSTKMEDDEGAQERDEELMRMVRTMYSQTQAMSSDYQRNVDLKNKLLNELNARRRDRIDSIRKSGTTFIGLIQSFRDRETREKQGRHMELVRMAKDKKKTEWNSPVKFPGHGNVTDCILMDENSILPEKEVIRMDSNTPSILMERYLKEKDKTVLIIDDDMRRLQFFQDTLGKTHKLQFASNPDKAKDILNTQQFNLICLDYDLGLAKKGSDVVDFILFNELCLDSDILIQSTNKVGSKKMLEALKGNRKVEACDFEILIKTFGETNAEIGSTGREEPSN